MAETKKTTAKKATAAKSTAVKSSAAKKPAAKKATTPTKTTRRAVARPVTRAAARPVDRAERPVVRKPAAPKPKAEPRPLPAAPAGQVALIAADGSVSGTLPLPAVLAEAKRRAGVLAQALSVAYSNAHLGTAATKDRSRVSGGGSKPWRQKGTGRARQGSTRAPHWRHGGVVFGPNGRSYDRRIPEKMRREAFGEALALRARDGRVLAYEGLAFEDGRPRTKAVVEWLGKIGDTGKTLLVTREADELTARAATNATALSVRSVGTLRTADVLMHDTLLVRRDALEALAARARTNGGAA